MATTQQMIDFYIEAEQAVLMGQTIQHNGKTLTLANLEEIRRGRREWENRQMSESRKGRRGSLARFI